VEHGRSLRIAVVILAATLVAAAVETVQARPEISVSLPSAARSGEVVAATIRLPRKVAAVDGRVLVDGAAAELIGVAPSGGGSALAPLRVADGYAFGAYGLAPRDGRVELRLVLLPKADGKLKVRVVIDALADARGKRLSAGRTALLGKITVDGGTKLHAAPRGSARKAPTKSAGPVRSVFGRAVIAVEDLDMVRAAWYGTRERGRSCAPGSDANADANGDGCVDIVDLQAVAVSQGARVAGAVAPSVRASAAVFAVALSPARTFTVTSVADTPDQAPGNGLCADASGACTLRAALTESNWQAGQSLVNFNLPGTAPVTIQLGSALPGLGTSNGSVYIDGYSQPGSRPNDAPRGTNAIPGVELRGPGSSTSWIFYVPQRDNVIRGLLLNNTQRGIFLDGPASTGNLVVGNWIGFNRDNSLPPRGIDGVRFNSGAHDNIVGTPALADRNVIGNWDKAIYGYGANTTGNVVQNNVLCIRPDGSGAICQVGADFDFGPKNTLFGGSGPTEGNVVGPTCCNAVELSHGWNPSGGDSSAWLISGNRIIGNWLGFRADGSYDPAFRSAQSEPTFDNGQAVNVYDGSPNNVVEGNFISSAHDGVTVASASSGGNVVRDNVIGRSPQGQAAPLTGWGIYLRWETQVHSLVSNQIENAAAGGIGLIDATVGQVTISRNLVDATSGPALYFAPDSNNPQTGANDLLAGPTLAATSSEASGTALPGATVELYRASRPAGQTGLPIAYLGSAAADGAGDWSLPVNLVDGDVVTALQTRADGTSSLLSLNVVVGPPPTPPSADFSWSQQAGTQTVAFSDSSTGAPSGWSWAFGDGSSSTSQNPSHAYTTAGDYQVSLTASNGGGSSTVTRTVHVDPVPGSPLIAVDGFGRSVSSDWGSADIGGAYTSFDNVANYNVSAGAGRMTVPKAGNTRRATLGAVSAHDVDMLVRVSIDKMPVGGAQYVYAFGRSAGDNRYQPKMILYPNGTVAVHAGLMLNNSESSLGPAVTVPGLNLVAGGSIWLRGRITGANPTTIGVRAWADGQIEPAGWQFSATDSAAALQGAGGVGLAAYMGSATSNAPVTFSFDDYSASDPSAGPPAPPTAAFDWAQQPGTLAVAFTDTSTGSPTAWSWDFGDGTSSTERNPTRTYTVAGAYEVTLNASNSSGSSSVTHLVSVNAPGSGTTYALDSFTRTEAQSWGTADIGGPWSPSGTAALNVASDVGTITPPRANSTRSAQLDEVSARDVDISFRVALDKVPAGGTVWVYAATRRNGNSEYRPKLLFYANGSVAVHASQVVYDVESPIGSPITVPGLTYTAGQFVRVHVRVAGSGPTAININAWPDGQPEPAGWLYGATNANSALQVAGSVALRVYVAGSVSSMPLSAQFDDYSVSGLESAPPVTASAVLVGAGDIGACDSTADSDTAAVIADIAGTVFTAGDNAYPNGLVAARTRPVPGSHEFQTPGASGYFDYFGAAAGFAGRGYYAYEAGAWRVYALNSECASNGTCTDQYNWLAADIVAAPHAYSMAIWHRPRYRPGPHGGANDLDALFTLLYTGGVEPLISGHDRLYARLTPADATATADPVDGVRQFVVGTDGSAWYMPVSPLDLVEVENHETHGVLRLDLAADDYARQFLPAGTGTFTDSGLTGCQ